MLKEVKTKEARVMEKIIQTPTNPVRPPQDTIEIEARIATNPEIMQRIAQGDAATVSRLHLQLNRKTRE